MQERQGRSPRTDRPHGRGQQHSLATLGHSEAQPNEGPALTSPIEGAGSIPSQSSVSGELASPITGQKGRVEVLEAWSRGYALLGRMILRGVQAEDLDSLREDPDLWAALPRRGEAVDLDLCGAEHYALFDRSAHPHAGVYLHKEAIVGAGGETLLELCGARGLSPEAPPDHLGSLLLTLSQASALGDLEGSRALLGAHLLPWLTPVSDALLQEGSAFWRAALELLLDVVSHQVTSLDAAVLWGNAPPLWTISEDEGLSALITSLLTPVTAGGQLSGQELSRLGAELGLPTGFGGRRLVLKNLFSAAADFERTPRLLGALSLRFARMAERYEAFSRARPALAGCVGPWRLRAAHTARTLRQLEEVAEGASQPATPGNNEMRARGGLG